MVKSVSSIIADSIRGLFSPALRAQINWRRVSRELLKKRGLQLEK